MIEGDAAVVASIRLSQKPFDFCRPRIIIQCDFQTKILLNDGLGNKPLRYCIPLGLIITLGR